MNEEGTDQTQGGENHDDNDIVKIRSIITQHGGFETLKEADRRKAVFEKLESLVHSFMLSARADHLNKQREKHPEMHIPEPESSEPPGRLFSFGSYRLDVCGKDADIDTLCVAPSFVTRCDFFYKFGEMLKNLPDVSDYLAIPLSFVPVLKMKYNQIEVDILFANLSSFESIPENLQIHDDELLRTMEVRCVRSLNGCRNTDEILNSVKNLEVFRLTLRVIKIWAKRRGVYSNMLGYLGGFACAMLVAKAAKMNPNADVPTLIHKFFTLFSKWHWPEPVLLKPLYIVPDMTFTVWNKDIWNSHDLNLMPIITPAYPQQNSTHNVTQSSFKVIKEEFERGYTVTNEIINHTEDWAKLFDEPPFFSSYTRYCVLTATAESQESFKKWTGLVVSKIRVLIGNLDRNPDVDIAHINDQTFTKLVETSEGKIIYTQHWFIGIQYEKTTQLINLFITEQQLFRSMVNQQCKNQKIYSPDMKICTKMISPKELPQYLDREQLHLPPGDGEHGNTNGFMSDEGRRKVESSMKINDIKHHQPTSNNNINGGMGDSSSFADHKPNRNTKSMSDSHVAGQKRKSPPASFVDNHHNQLHYGGLYHRAIEPPSKFRITGKSATKQLFQEPPPPGTEPLPPGTEPLHPPSPVTSDIGYFDEAMSAAPISVVNGHTKHIPMNGGSGGTLVGFHSFGGSVNYATPIPVIGSRKIHVISSASSPTSGFASSPIPTLMTNNRWTREPQHPQCMDVDMPSPRCRGGRSISVVSSTQPSSEDLYYDSMMSSDSSPPSTSYHHHHHHNNHITTSFSSIQAAPSAAHYNNSMSPQSAAAPIDDPPPPSSRTTPSSSKQRIVTCKRRSSERKQTKEQTSSSRRHHHHSKHSVHRRHESSRMSSSRSHHVQHSRSFRNDSPEYEHRRTRRKKRSSTSSSSHNSVMIRSRNSF